MSDKAVLDFIEQLPIVKAHSEDIEKHEIAAAMIQADAAIISKHAQMFEEGLVQTPDGKWQYNPKQYKALVSYRKNLYEQLQNKQITPDEFTQRISVAPAAEPYDESAVKNNPYQRRIKAIIDARKDDESLEYMMHDIEEGDGVVKILNELEKEDQKQNTSDTVKEQARKESETLDFERGTVQTESTENVLDSDHTQTGQSQIAPEDQQISEASKDTTVQQSNTAAADSTIKLTPKEKYNLRKKRAVEKYKNRKSH